MVFSYLTKDNIFTKFEQSRQYTELLTAPFPEYSRLARNKPSEKIKREHPKVTDGTAAGIVRKLSRRSVQQLPTGVIESEKDDDYNSILAEFIYLNRILPNANEEYDLIQKAWTIIENGATFGSQAVYTPFLDHDGVFSSDMTLPYWGDIFLQKGKKSGPASDYVFMRTWWQDTDVEATIEREKTLAKKAKMRGEKYVGQYDIAALERIKEAITKKDDKAQTPSEADLNLNPEGIEIVTGFQKGVKAKFITFNPATEEVIREKENKDPRGKMPIDWYYYDLDGSNPLGRGLIELIAPLQNLIDSDMQMYQYNRALSLGPPIKKKGKFNKRNIVFAPNAVIDMGDDPNADIEALSIDTTGIANYANIYGLQKSQMLNLVSSPDTSISSEVGNPGFGRTPTAIKTQNNNVSVDDNAVRKGFEAFFENWSETSINVYFAERRGKEVLQLDEETASRLRELEAEGKMPPGKISEQNEILVDYDEATPKLKFRINAQTSKVNSEQAQLEALDLLVQTLDGSPSLTAVVPIGKKVEVWNSIVANSAVEGSDDLKISKKEMEELMQAQMAQQAQQIPVGEDVNALPEQPPIDPMQQFASELYDAGVPEDLVTEAVQLVQKGYSEDEALGSIMGVLEQETAND
ncbi:hypothetical protein I8H89_00350 [Candidatus Saccharibacteria bacterium]|nr:hypothetical protein [Candidatus Saccharibacteria bacterium]